MSGSDATPSIRWMFHTTAMVADYDEACGRLEAFAGLTVLEYSENTQPEIGRRGGMTWLAGNSIEIGQPIVESGGAARFVARSGGGMHSVAVQIHDVNDTIAHVEGCGVRVAARPMPEFFFTDPRDTDGVFIEWGSFELDIDPRFGAASPPPSPNTPVLRVVGQAFVGAVVHDPPATAEKLAGLLGSPVTFVETGAGVGDPMAGVSLGDCTLALFALPGDSSMSLWGRDYPQPRTHLLGLLVEDLGDAAGRLEREGVAVIRRSDTMIVVDPTATGGVQLALVDRLLENDPRL